MMSRQIFRATIPERIGQVNRTPAHKELRKARRMAARRRTGSHINPTTPEFLGGHHAAWSNQKKPL
jgi:hypothetical protein